MRQGVVVIDLLNGISGTRVTARAVGNAAEFTRMAYRYVRKHSPAPSLSILRLPGLAMSDWVARAEASLREVGKGDSVRILAGGYDVTEPTRQMALMRTKLLQSKPDYVLATSFAAISAARLQAPMRTSPQNRRLVCQ